MKKLIPYILLVSVLQACGSQEPAPEASETVAVADTLQLTADQLEKVGISATAPEMTQINTPVELNGRIELPPQYMADLNPPLPGYVVELRVKGGEAVKKGQQLAVLEHPDYIELQRRYLEAKSLLALGEREYQRQRDLAKAEATAAKSLEKAESDYRIQQANVAALAAQLKRLGIDPDKLTATTLHTTIALKAPFDGFVAAVDGAIGRFVGSDKPLVQLVNKAHMHVELQLFEKDLDKVAIGQKLTFQLLNAGQQRFRGDVFLISPTVDPVTRSVNIHGHIDDENDFLRPGMFVKASIETGSRRAWVLPGSALVQSGNSYVVFAELKTGSFRRTVVELGQQADGKVALSGIDSSMKYVHEGAEYLEAYYQQLLAPEEE